MPVLEGDCLVWMKRMPAEGVDAVVTDPPYDLGFMGKSWDKTGIAFRKETWEGVMRVMKPGSHLLAFGGTRTYHRMAVAIEDAGFEVRDMVQWLYGSGFPKSSNQKGEWDGWGTALKPACEPIILARKPLAERTVARNVLEYGTGALNIAATRIGYQGDDDKSSATPQGRVTSHSIESIGAKPNIGQSEGRVEFERSKLSGRWPANVIMDEEAGAMLDAQTGVLISGARRAGKYKGTSEEALYGTFGEFESAEIPLSKGGASRFFYCAKTPRSERNAGLGHFDTKPLLWSAGTQNPGSFQAQGTEKAAKNNHPTVKPIALMRYLIRLITPPNGHVLDPFLGSGTTGIAAGLEGMRFTGIELDADYVKLARARIKHWEGRNG